MNKEIISLMDQAIDIIDKKNDIFIASHISPDGDNVGSVLGLALALEKIGKKVNILKTDEIPVDYKFLPGVDKFELEKSIDFKEDTIIILDSSDLDRLGDKKNFVETFENIINIDHHISNDQFGTINIIDPKAAATGELVYTFINRMGVELDKDIGTNIYTAISTDTGKFSYESVTSNTHRIVAELIDAGINIKDINIELYENIDINRSKLLIKSMSEMTSYFEDKLIVVKVSQAMLKDTNCKMEDTEGIVAFIRQIKGVEVACLLKEGEDSKIKVSLRSKYNIDVSKICEFFGGGGHIRAAGCSIKTNLSDAEDIIVKKIREYIG